MTQNVQANVQFLPFFYSTGKGISNPPESRRDFLKIGQACGLKSFTCWRLKFIHLCHTLLSNELTFVWFSIENLKVHKLMNTHQLLNWISIHNFESDSNINFCLKVPIWDVKLSVWSCIWKGEAFSFFQFLFVFGCHTMKCKIWTWNFNGRKNGYSEYFY